MEQVPNRRPIVLLVEDDDNARHAYGVMLEDSGIRVIEAATGPDAVRCANEERPDLILMDMHLPIIGGCEAARMIKAEPATASVPLVAFSAHVDSIADLPGDVCVFDGFIAKPVVLADLIDRVNAYVDLVGSRQRRRTIY